MPGFVYLDEFFYLTTQGRRSGESHEIEIWYVEYDGCFYLCSEAMGASDWVRNLMVTPEVAFWVQGYSGQGYARPFYAIDDPERYAAVAALFDAKYSWSDGLMVEIRPL